MTFSDFLQRIFKHRKAKGTRTFKAKLRRVWRRSRFEQLERRELLFAANWTNVLQPLDVTGDASPDVSPLDVLVVINELNSPAYTTAESKKLPSDLPDESKRPFLDVDCDSFVSPLDVLAIINAINSENYDPSWVFSSDGGSSNNAGRVTPSACFPKLVEGDSFRTELSARVIVPATPSAVSVQFDTPDFDQSSRGLIRDAFEISLVDVQGTPIVAPISVSGDAVFNATEGYSAQVANGVVAQTNEVLIGLGGIPAGTIANVVVRLVNNDGDHSSQVRIKRAHLVNSNLNANLTLPANTSSAGAILDSTPPTVALPLAQDPLPDPSAPQITDVVIPQRLPTGTQFTLTGKISVTQNANRSNAIQSITINGRVVGALDAAGRFFETLTVFSGQNVFTIVATDVQGRSTKKTLALVGTNPAGALSDLAQYEDVSSSFSGVYGRTQFNEATNVLSVDLASKNEGSFRVNAPLIVTISNISDPTVRVTNADGVTSQLDPYVNYTNRVVGKTLAPTNTSDAGSIEFSNPNRVQFTYDLGFFSKINAAPLAFTVPSVEAVIDKNYGYAFQATDENGDTISYRLTESPKTMTIDAASGKIAWAPTAADLGNHIIAIEARDGAGGVAVQRYTLSVIAPPANRPPLILSTPEVDAFHGQPYAYNLRAVDPDGDSLSYRFDGSGHGLKIDKATGAISWETPGSQTYNAADDFSRTDNPNGLWTYGWTNTLGSEFHLFPNHVVTIGLDSWNDPSIGSEPIVSHNGTASPIGVGSVVWQPGQMSMHPGSSNTHPVARWTVPATGKIQVSAAFSGLDRATTDVHVLQNGFSIFDGTINGQGSQANMSPQWIIVNAGDTIDFTIGFGNGNYFSDTTSIDARILDFTAGDTVPLSVIVDDGKGGTARQSFTLDVHQAIGNHNPSIVSTPQTSVSFGQVYTDTVEAIDSDGDRLQYSLPDAPPGMTIDANSGKITWIGFEDQKVVEAPPPSNGLTLSTDALAAGYELTEFAHHFPSISSIGPLGISFPSSGGILVSGYSGEMFRFPKDVDGQDARSANIPASFGFNRATDMAQVGSHIYMTQQSGGAVLELNENGTFKQTIVTGLAIPLGIVANPTNGHLIVADAGSNGIFDIDPITKTSSRLFSGTLDGISINEDGTVLYGAGASGAIGNIYGYSLKAGSVGSIVFESGFVPGAPDGTAIGGGSLAGTIFANTNGGTIIAIDLQTKKQSVIASGGSRGDFAKIDPNNGTMLLTQSDSIVRLRLPIGSSFTATTNGLKLTPEASSAGFELTELARNIPSVDIAGPLGIAFPSTGGVLVSDRAGNIRRFPTSSDGQNAESFAPSQNYGFTGAVDIAKVGNKLYMTQFTTAGVAEINDDGTFNQTIVTGLLQPLGIVATPSNGRLIVSTGVQNSVFEVDPIAKTSKVLFNAQLDGITLSADGSILYGAATDSHIYGYSLGEGSIGNIVFDSGIVPGGPDGTALGGGEYEGILFANTNQGTVIAINLITKQQIVIASGGTRGDFAKIDPTNGTLLLTQKDTIARLRLPPGSSFLSDFDVKVEVTDGNGGSDSLSFRLHLNDVHRGEIRGKASRSTGVPGGESPFSNIVVFLDQNQNGQRDTFEKAIKTDVNGNYQFKGLIPGTYFVTQANQPGWRVTTPAAGSYSLNLSAASAIDGIDFTNVESTVSEIQGLVFNDLNGDGLQTTATVSASVPGTSDPWLAGMPDGSTASGGDTAPGQSPVFLDGMTLYAGTPISFQVTGSVSFNSTPSNDPPDGSGFGSHGIGAENGIANITAPSNSLIAVFLDDDQPSLTAAPPALDFQPNGNVVGGLNYLSLSPKLKQVFFVGDGLSQTSVRQQVIVPEGATRLYLGTMDGFGWFNNTGSFSVTVSRTEPGLKDWSIYLDKNNNGTKEANEPSTLTDEHGNYSFSNIEPGTYTVAEQLNSNNWHQTAPTTKTFPLTVVAGEVRRRIDFGNQDLAALPPPNHSPKLTSSAPKQIDAGVQYVYQAQAKDIDGDPLRFDLPVMPKGMAIDSNSGIIVWTPTIDQVGSQNVVLRVSDDRGGVGLQSFQVVVASANIGPTITSKPQGPAVAGVPYQYRVRAQDPNGDAISFGLKSTPIGDMTIDAQTGTFTWHPTLADVGTHTIEITATDGDGAGQGQRFDLIVLASAPNRAPLIKTNPPEEIRLGRNYLYAVDAIDPDGDPMLYQLETKPSGMSIDSNGVITWAPTETQFGAHQVKIRVSDGRGGSSVQSFLINVRTQSANHAPTFTSTPPVAASLTHGFLYDAKAVDVDGDTIAYSVVRGPSGMSIDTLTGAIRWAPTEEQLGLHKVVIQAMDQQAAVTLQDFDVTVRGSNLPPVIASIPNTIGMTGRVYTYTIRASDPEGGQLTYTLLSSSGDMTIDSSGVVRWTPTAGELGQANIAIRVADEQGATTDQTYSIAVSAALPNQSPNITSQPLLIATVDREYRYQVTATDPEGTSVRFAFLEVPNGMVINENTGLITWTSNLAGIGRVTVLVSDLDGGESEQSFEVTVRESNLPPTINSSPITTVSAGETYRYNLNAVDPNSDPLTYSVTSGPSRLVIDSFGRITWPTNLADTGSQHVKVTVADDSGATTVQEYDIVLALDTESPKARIQVSSNPIALGEVLDLLVTATDNMRVESLDATFDGKPISLDSRGRASLTMTKAGTIQIIAIAKDAVGNSTQQTKELLVIDTSVTDAPEVDVTVPAENATITSPTDIIGTVRDPNLVSWKVEVAPVAGGAFTQIASGMAEVNNAKLATFDPTLLQNDSYIVRLTAFNSGGLTSSIDTTVNVSGDLKLGNFRMSFTDISIPLAGIPILATRTYDTLTSNQGGDLGYGWKLSYRDVDLRTNLSKTGDEAGGLFPPFRDGTRVYVTLPGGKREGFTFKPKAVGLFDPYQKEQVVPPEFQSGNGLRAVYFVPSFVPDNGVTSRLSVPRYQLSKQGHEYFQYGGGLPYNPEDPAYLGRYTVTRDGFDYSINGQSKQLMRVRDANGTSLSFDQDTITSSRGVSIKLTRDLSNRIVSITDPSGNSVQYGYDSVGNLASVTDRSGNQTRFVYRQSPPHYLDQVIDPLGNIGVRTNLDAEGRVVSLTDANGNTTQKSYSSDSSSEEIVDALGRKRLLQYNDRGNSIREVDAFGRVTQRSFDSDNHLLSLTDALGNTTTYEYDDTGNQVSARNPLGATTIFVYDAAGRVLTAIDAHGNSNATTYDEKGNITSLSDSGWVRKFEQDDTGRLASMTDPGGGVNTYTSDNRGNVTRRENALGTATRISYDVNGRPLTESVNVTTKDGTQTVETERTYDADGRVLTVVDAINGMTRNQYDAAGRLIETRDPLNRSTKYFYDERGLLIRTVYPDETSTSSSYDAEGQKISSTDESGRVTKFVYDLVGQLTETVFPDATPTSDSDNPRSKSIYDAIGNVIATIDPTGVRTSYLFDAAGRQIESSDAFGNKTRSEYDAVGRQIEVVNPLGARTRFKYDAFGKLVETIFPDGTSARASYDDSGRVRSQTDQSGAITRYEYDAAGRLGGVIDALGNRSQSVYDELGRLIRRIDSNGNTTSFGYDGNGRQIYNKRPLGQESTTTYDAAGQSIRTINFDGSSVDVEFDARGRVTSQNLSTGGSIRMTYTPTGQPSTTIDSRGTNRFTYDNQDRLVRKVEPDGQAIDYSYDLAGRLIQLKTALNTTQYAYDQAGRLKQVSSPGNPPTTYEYDSVGRPISVILPDGTQETRAYDLIGRLLSVETKLGNTTISSFRYSVDAVGRRTELIEGSGRTVDYSYDSLGRLTKEAIHEPGQELRSIQYSYDSVGNRLTKTDSLTGTTNYFYNGNDELLLERSAIGETTYTFDGRGNLLSKSDPTMRAAYQWNALGQLISTDIVSTNENHHQELTYDANGNRVSQIEDGVELRFLVDTNRTLPMIMEERTSSGIVSASYVYGSDRIYQVRSTVTSVYHGDGIGSTRYLTNQSGVVTDRYTFDAFGVELSRSGATENRFLFAGEARDRYTGLDYLRARYYQSSDGRFASTDPFPGNARQPLTLHRYLYAGDDPVNRTDPTGLFFSGSVSEQLTLINFTSWDIVSAVRLAKTAGTLFEQVKTFGNFSKLLFVMTSGLLAWNGPLGGTYGYVLYRFEAPDFWVTKAEGRYVLNEAANQVFSFNFDLSTTTNLKPKVSIAYNRDRGTLNVQLGFNYPLIEVKVGAKPAQYEIAKAEVFYRRVFESTAISDRFGLEGTFMTFGKVALTVFDRKGNGGFFS